ncbi:hypothetical protein ACLKA7_000892, partial [Drosophila subpalustris]
SEPELSSGVSVNAEPQGSTLEEAKGMPRVVQGCHSRQGKQRWEHWELVTAT